MELLIESNRINPEKNVKFRLAFDWIRQSNFNHSIGFDNFRLIRQSKNSIDFPWYIIENKIIWYTAIAVYMWKNYQSSQLDKIWFVFYSHSNNLKKRLNVTFFARLLKKANDSPTALYEQSREISRQNFMCELWKNGAANFIELYTWRRALEEENFKPEIKTYLAAVLQKTTPQVPSENRSN